MIDITEQQLIKYLEKYANKEISMTNLVKILQTDYRTLNNKIIRLSVDYPELYEKIVKNNPYTQKSRSDIDYEVLMIYILKKNITIQDAVAIFNVSEKTIQRRIKEEKEKNPELYKLFKSVIRRGRTAGNYEKFQEEINQLEYRDVIISEKNEQRKEFLLQIETRFNSLIDEGKTKEQSAKEMGYTLNYVYKMLNELYRIKIEEDTADVAKKFRKSLSYQTQDLNRENDNTQNKEINPNESNKKMDEEVK